MPFSLAAAFHGMNGVVVPSAYGEWLVERLYVWTSRVDEPEARSRFS